MSKAVLKMISDAMKSLGIAYGFMEYNGNPLVYPYYVGEYSESESVTEDGLQESTFMLTGFSRGSWLDLENTKEKIEKYFGIGGKTAILGNGSGVAVFYSNALVVPTDDADLKRIQINLIIKEWRVS